MIEIVTVNLGEAIELAKERERQKRIPGWKRYYDRHREKELARRREYREKNREAVAEYNRNYYRSRKMRKAVATGQASLLHEAAHA